jgi:predicted dienelactone hydrolase
MKLRSCILLVLFLAGWFLAGAGFVFPVPADSASLAASEVPVWGRPGPYGVAVSRYTWKDDRRDREVPVKIYYPAQDAGPFPVIIFSHGLGGSREGYEYLGRQWASHGYVSVHLQHPGSDRAVWENSWSKLLALWQAAHNLQNSLNRPLDVSFALDQLEKLNQSESPLQGRLDLSRVGAAGHSFGAYTTMAIAGQVYGRPGGREISLADPRIKAAIPMSTPVPRKKDNPTQAYAKITIPCLHMTGTRDDSPIGETRAGERRVPFDYTDGSDQYLVTFQDGDHMIFSDHKRLLSRGDQDARFHDLIRLSTTVFWDAYLKGEAAARSWLANGGLAGALGAYATLEMKLPGRTGPAGSRGQ